MMRVKFWQFLLLTGAGKGARYAILLGLVQWLGGSPAPG